MLDLLALIGRDQELFTQDIEHYEAALSEIITQSKFLVLGGAGSIGQAVTKQIFKRHPQKLHVVDISENNTVELVRDIRSSMGYINGDFQTFALDIGSDEYDAFFDADGDFDYVLNLSALKHVRSEKDPYTLMRMIEVNILNVEKTLKQCIEKGVKKYFCVSTDKAANPVNMMGASKRIMEMFVTRRSHDIEVSTARFANVAFSDGSLLHGFNQRIEKRQPIVAPTDIKRYFILPEESGELCLMSCLLGNNRDIFFPKLSEAFHLISFADIATKYLKGKGYEPYICSSEEEARALALTLPDKGQWPCWFTQSDTTGEKDFEEFFTANEVLDMVRFHGIGVIATASQFDNALLDHFEKALTQMKQNKRWTRAEIVELFSTMLPNFEHKETGKYLDSKM